MLTYNAVRYWKEMRERERERERGGIATCSYKHGVLYLKLNHSIIIMV